MKRRRLAALVWGVAVPGTAMTTALAAFKIVMWGDWLLAALVVTLVGAGFIAGKLHEIWRCWED